MNEKLKKGDKIWVVCDNNPKLTPSNTLAVFKTKRNALEFVGKYVCEINKSTYTGYIQIIEMSIGIFEENKKFLGMELMINGK